MSPEDTRKDSIHRLFSEPLGIEADGPDALFGTIAVQEGFVTEAQLQEALRSGAGRPLDQVLPDLGLLTKSQVQAVQDIRRLLTAESAAPPPLEAPSGGKDSGHADGSRLPLGDRKRLGRYELLEVLGEGGMGVVFRARDEELGRQVALKMLKTVQSFSPSQIERFQREERNAARLRHPGIVTIYEIGREGDALYYTMELVPGRPFNDAKGDLNERVAILEKVARAVHYAHEQGVIHRDLKPGNILVDAEGEPHLLDFGLSRDLQTPSDLSRTGGVLGTPYYMSPEQARGRVHEVGARSDVYALGTILYEVLTGHVPFSGPTVAEVVRQIVTEDPDPPPGPPDLVTLCLKAMEKEPARRYATAAAFADDLARFLAGDRIAARPAGAAYRVYRRLRKNPLVYALGVGTGAALTAAAAIWLVGLQRARSLEAENAEARRAGLQSIRETARISLDAALELRRAGNPMGMRPFLAYLEAAYRKAVEHAPDLAEVDYLMGRMHRALMDDGKALNYQELALRKDGHYAPALYERAVLQSKKYGRDIQSRWNDLLREPEGHEITPETAQRAPQPTREQVEVSHPELAQLRARIVTDCIDLQWLHDPGHGSSGPVGVSQARVLAARGILAHHQGKYAEAQVALLEAVEKDPSLEEAWETLALSAKMQAMSDPHLRERNWIKAEEWYTQGLSHDRGYLPHLLGRSEVRKDRAEYRRERGENPLPDQAAAEEDLTRILEFDKDSEEAWMRRGMIRSRRGFHLMYIGKDPRPDYAAAEADFTQAMRVNPKAPAVWMGRGKLRSYRGVHLMYRGEDPLDDFAQAGKDFAEALRLNKELPDSWYGRGYMQAWRGIHRMSRGEDPRQDFAGAEEDLTQTLRLNRASWEAWMRLGMTRMYRGIYRMGLGEDPMGDYAEAEKDLNEAWNQGGHNALVKIFLGKTRTYRGVHRMDQGEDPLPDYTAAEEDLNQGLQLNKGSATGWAELGNLRLQIALFRERGGDRRRAVEEYAAAAHCFAEAFKVNPLLDRQFGEAHRRARQKAEELRRN